MVVRPLVPLGIALLAAGALVVHVGPACSQTTPMYLSQWSGFDGPQRMASDRLGYVYVADTFHDRIQEFDPYGNLYAQWGATGTGAGQFRHPRGVAIGPDDNVYVTDTDNNRVQVFDWDGNYLRSWGGPGSGPVQFLTPLGIGVDGYGFVYVADAGNHRVQKFDLYGNDHGQWGSLGAGPSQFNQPQGVGVYTNPPVVYVYVADYNNHRIQKFTGGGQYLGQWGGYGSNPGQLILPQEVAAAQDGAVYVADTGNHRIQKFDGAGAWVAQWGHYGSGTGEFNLPIGITTCSRDVYVSDTGNNRIQHFVYPYYITATAGPHGHISPNGVLPIPPGYGQNFTIWPEYGWSIADVVVDGVSVGPVGGYFFDAVSADHSITASFAAESFTITASAGPGGTIDPQGEIVVTPGSNLTFTITPHAAYHIADVVVDGASVGPVATYTFGSIDAAHTIAASFGVIPISAPQFLLKWGSQGNGDGQFSWTEGMTVDGTGSVYITDFNRRCVQVFDASGRFLRKWGSAGFGDGQFVGPVGIAAGPDGTVYVADEQFHRVQKFTAAGEFLSKWGSAGTGDGQFDSPHGIAVSGGNVYVTELENHRVQRFTTDGVFLGKWGVAGSLPGEFFWPQGVAVDAAGDVYVTDSGNSRIQKFTEDGTFLAEWGTYGAGPGQFDEPYGITVAGDRILVVEYWGKRVQVFTPDGVYRTGWGSAGSGDGEFSYPCDIAIDARENVFVLDSGNRRVQRFGTHFVITALPAANGTITPSGDISVAPGADASYSIAPNAGYHIAELLVDGTPSAALPNHTFAAVAADHSIGARFAPGTTGVAGRSIPAFLALGAPAPQPSRGEATMTVSLPRAAEVRLAIHDLAGRTVRTLIRDRLDAGEVRAVWDGCDDHGRAAASAVYFCRLEAEGRAFVRRLVLTR